MTHGRQPALLRIVAVRTLCEAVCIRGCRYPDPGDIPTHRDTPVKRAVAVLHDVVGGGESAEGPNRADSAIRCRREL
eukprot:4939352-Prymnesium_polylepis.1